MACHPFFLLSDYLEHLYVALNLSLHSLIVKVDVEERVVDVGRREELALLVVLVELTALPGSTLRSMVYAFVPGTTVNEVFPLLRNDVTGFLSKPNMAASRFADSTLKLRLSGVVGLTMNSRTAIQLFFSDSALRMRT